MLYDKVIYCSAIFLIPLISGISGYSQYLRNGAMDAPEETDEIPPYFWGICDEDSDPNTLLSWSPADDPSIVITSPDNSWFCLMRARSRTLAYSHHGPGTHENLFTELITPLERNHCYRFSAYFITSDNAENNDMYEPDVSYPLRFQVWGGLDSCSLDELLIDSDPIDNMTWKRYEFTFTVRRNNYPYIYIRPYWDTIHIKEERYNGIIMMDDLDLQLISAIDTFPDETAYYSIDPPIILHAENGVSYDWSPRDFLSSDSVQSPVLLNYTEHLSVAVYDEFGCPSFQHFNIVYDCDSVYRNPLFRTSTVYYKYNETIVLEASEGVSYLWEPQDHLSDYTVQSPELVDYYSQLHVTVEDDHGCNFQESFTVLADCDTLYPNKVFQMLDTLVNYGQEISLVPSTGTFSSAWSPASGLSCIECNQPVATPQSTTLYSIQLTDRFDCTHEELFNIEIKLVIPNVITPNGDGYNDRFFIPGLPPGSSLSIYRKDGLLIYVSDNYGNNTWWNGVDMNGDNVEPGTYWYTLEIPAIKESRNGFIFVKR